MIPELSIGLSWKHVKVIGTGIEERVLDYGNGTGARIPKQEYFEALCDCGKTFRIWVSEWKGKKYISDCGCGISLKDGENVMTMISGASLWRQSMKRYARANGLSLSRAIVELSGKSFKEWNEME